MIGQPGTSVPDGAFWPDIVYSPVPEGAQQPRGDLPGELEDDPPLDPPPAGAVRVELDPPLRLRFIAARRRRTGRWVVRLP